MHISISDDFPLDQSTCSELVLRQHRMLENKFISGLIDSIPHVAFVVNGDREIVLYNRSMEEMVRDFQHEELLGKRPGELLHCGNAVGCRCGESSSCSQCGCMQAMLDAFDGDVGNEECTLLSEFGGLVNSYIFKVAAAPLEVEGEFFCIVYLTDISDRKNKEVVEKIFLHDLMNVVNGIASAGSLLREEAVKDSSRQLADIIVERSMFMANEINAHRLFVSAESRVLEISCEELSVFSIVDSVCRFFAGSPFVKDKGIKIDHQVQDFTIATDKRLLYRVLENLLKNAIEASPKDGTVTIKAVMENDSAVFTVNNQGVIPLPVANQIFKRSFSTKGIGRGLGTYSVKMFTENYLQGRAWFDSSYDEGTNFYIQIPLRLAGQEQ